MAKKRQTLLNGALSGVIPALEAMSDNELRNVRSAPKKMTNTNCWWLAYSMAPELSRVADSILKQRARERRASAKKAATEGPKP
jgi:hypothetical protein